MENEYTQNEEGEKKSILDQIISNHQAEEVANLDAVEIIQNLFGELNERERDVLTRRFGLNGKEKETLEGIGNVHKLTRERIRQIETAAVKKLRQLKRAENYIAGLKRVINQLLEEHGGLMEKEYLLNNLVNFSAGGYRGRDGDLSTHKNNLDFLISKLLHDHFEEVNSHRYFKPSFKLKHQLLDHLEELAVELLDKIKEAKTIYRTDELFDLAGSLDSYKKHEEKFDTPNNLDISNVLKNDLFEEKAELVNANKPIYSLLQAAKHIEQNKFGHWGHYDWREIKPKTINDKIYLVLKNHGKPMHFVDITNRINEIDFDGKKANAATVHNELILDKKYILVGRGLYSLKEWGYQKGTVAEVIEEILKQADAELTRDEIIDKVMAQRLVKRATIILALMNRNKFDKTDGKYKVKVNS
jgi:hypothetical protein